MPESFKNRSEFFYAFAYDPFSYLGENKRGGINVIDLANVYSCSFIATDDTGISQRGKFELRGRIEKSDLRGCNLLVE